MYRNQHSQKINNYNNYNGSNDIDRRKHNNYNYNDNRRNNSRMMNNNVNTSNKRQMAYLPRGTACQPFAKRMRHGIQTSTISSTTATSMSTAANRTSYGPNNDDETDCEDAMDNVAQTLSTEMESHFSRLDKMKQRHYLQRNQLAPRITDLPVMTGKKGKTFMKYMRETWFIKLYHPDFVLARHRRIAVDCEKRLKVYCESFDKGDEKLCCPDLSYSMSKIKSATTTISNHHYSKPNASSSSVITSQNLSADSFGACSSSNTSIDDICQTKTNLISELDMIQPSARIDLQHESKPPEENNKPQELQQPNNQKENSFTNSETPVEYLPFVFGTKERMKHDLASAITIMRSLDTMHDLPLKTELHNPLTDTFLDSLDEDDISQKLNYVITYVRLVHCYNYYSGEKQLDHSGDIWEHDKRMNMALRPKVNRIRQLTEHDLQAARDVDECCRKMTKFMYEYHPVTNARHAEHEKKQAIHDWIHYVTQKEKNGGLRCFLAPSSRWFPALHHVKIYLRSHYWHAYKDILMATGIKVYYENFRADPRSNEDDLYPIERLQDRRRVFQGR